MTMTDLLSMLRTRLAEQGHGAKAKLAADIEVTPQIVAAWTADPPRRHPDGERTLAILVWLTRACHVLHQ